MKITKSELIEMEFGTCELGRFICQTNDTEDPVDVASLVGCRYLLDSDLLWIASKNLSKERFVRFAKDCALINVELIKPYCSDEQYNAITHFLNGDDNADKVFKVDVYQKKYNTTPAGAQTKAGYAAYAARRAADAADAANSDEAYSPVLDAFFYTIKNCGKYKVYQLFIDMLNDFE